jgi:hypothetical protein
MGARTNFTIVTTEDPNQNINLYSHWGGDSGVMDLARALDLAMPRIRMHDTAYATRIIINALQEDHNTETGYGIYVGEVNHEEQYEYKEVDLINNTVTIGDLTTSIPKFVAYHLDMISAEQETV